MIGGSQKSTGAAGEATPDFLRNYLVVSKNLFIFASWLMW